MKEMFIRARRAGAPLVAVRTADCAAAITDLMVAAKIANGDDKEPPAVQWDAARGITPVNDRGKAALTAAQVKADDTINFVDAMAAVAKLPAGTVAFAHHVHRQLLSMEPSATAQSIQAVANLRDELKKNFRTLVMIGPTFRLPLEIEHDVVTITHPLPDRDALDAIARDVYKSASVALPKEKAPLTRTVDATSGLSHFAGETVMSMSIRENGMDIDACWERKRVTIEQAPGLRVWRGGERFDDIVGLDAVKTHLRRRVASRTPIGVVVWIDEIDKALGNVEHDTSGVKLFQLKTLLTEMDNHEWRGLIAAGVSGGGKSLIGKALGNEAGVPTIALDLGASESKFVGESESNMLHLVQVIEAVGSGNAYFVATSNEATVMRPELQRRFTDGIWMFDLLSASERAAAWTAYMKKYGLKAQPIPADDAWTGAEIRNCCRYAWDTNVSLVEAAQFIVPMATARAPEIERLRRLAHGRFLDASKPGPYQYDERPMAASVRAIMAMPSSAKESVN